MGTVPILNMDGTCKNGDDARSGSGELGRSLDAVEKRKSRDDSTHLSG